MPQPSQTRRAFFAVLGALLLAMPVGNASEKTEPAFTQADAAGALATLAKELVAKNPRAEFLLRDALKIGSKQPDEDGTLYSGAWAIRVKEKFYLYQYSPTISVRGQFVYDQKDKRWVTRRLGATHELK
jgi:hypothetical protein